MRQSDRQRIAKHYTSLMADELEALARVIALHDHGAPFARLLRRRAVQLNTLHLKPRS